MVCSKLRNLPERHTCCKEAWLKWRKFYNFGTFPDKLEAFVKKKTLHIQPHNNHASARGWNEMGYFYKTFAMLLLLSDIPIVGAVL
jgi:hypothetical protein